MKKLIISARAGLGNKIRVLLSAIEMSSREGFDLYLEWPDFNNLFELNYPYNYISYKEFLNIGGKENGDIKVQTYYADPRYAGYIYINLLKPILVLEKIIDNFSNKYKINETIGIHIRCHLPHIKNVIYPNGIFSVVNSVKYYSEIIERIPNKKFFVCSDDLRIEDYLKSKYEKRIIVYAKRDKRINRWDDDESSYEKKTDITALQDAIVDLYLLSKTLYIVHSEESSFSDIAKILSSKRNHVMLPLAMLSEI